jgi:acyl carrier protein
MNEQEINKSVYGMLKRIAPDTEPEKLRPQENIREALMIDSFDFLRFITAMDEHFGISTPEEDYGKLATMEKIAAYIISKKK